MRFAPKCRANLFPEQAGRSSLLFRKDLRKNFSVETKEGGFRENTSLKSRLKKWGSVVQVLRAKNNIFLGCTTSLRGKDLNQRPPGYRSAPFAVPESRRAQFTAFFPPPFDRCSLILSLLPPPAAVENQTQRAARRPHDPEPSPDNRFSQIG